MNFHYKIGFIGVGNLAQSMIKGLLDSKTLNASQIFASNRGEGKLLRAKEQFGINTCNSNEIVIESADIVILAMKPQDLSDAIDPIAGLFNSNQIVISLAAGVSLRSLQKKLPQCRIIRLMANTPALVRKGVFGYVTSESESSLGTVAEDLCKPLGSVFEMKDEDQFEAFTVASSAGPGFIFELMMYWQDWMEERGIAPEDSRKIVVDTFLGTAELAASSPLLSLEEMQQKVTSKKGVTAAGLESIRELEIERALRISFEKSALRNQDLAKQS